MDPPKELERRLSVTLFAMRTKTYRMGTINSKESTNSRKKSYKRQIYTWKCWKKRTERRGDGEISRGRKFQAERAVRNRKMNGDGVEAERVGSNLRKPSDENASAKFRETVGAVRRARENGGVGCCQCVSQVNESRNEARLEVVCNEENKMKIKERDLRNKLEHSRQALHFVVLAETKTLLKLYNAAEVTETGVIDTSSRPRDVDEKLWSRIVDALASIDIRNEEL